MYKVIVLVIIFIYPIIGKSQDFKVSSTNKTPCLNDTIQIIRPDSVPSSWTINDPSAFNSIGSLNGTYSFQIICNKIGTYTINGTTDNGFGTGKGKIEITVYGVNANFDIIKNKFNTYKINVKSSNQPEPNALPYYFSWDFGDEKIIKDSINQPTEEAEYYSSIEHSYSDSGIFNITLQVSNKKGCKDLKVIQNTITNDFLIPNFFTPNGDGKNDLFTARTNGKVPFSMVIYSRWGNVVFESKEPSTNVVWDGRLKSGNKVSSGVYYYVISQEGKTDANKLTGFVHIFHDKK